MSEENKAAGKSLYGVGDAETKAWFERQWKIWPERANQALTTNLSFHFGGVQQFRAENSCDPEMSVQFRSNIEWLDKHCRPSEVTP